MESEEQLKKKKNEGYVLSSKLRASLKKRYWNVSGKQMIQEPGIH